MELGQDTYSGGGAEADGELRLVAEDVTKSFRGVRALAGVSLELGPSEILGLIGPNGSGKTTLLNVLSGIYPATSGDVRCNGHDIHGKKPSQIVHFGIGRTFQNIRLFAHLSVRENVQVGSISGRKVSGVDHAVDVRELVHRFALDAVADQPAMSLPYGAQRRVEIARALAGRPHYLLLDEPAAGMNESESDDLLEMILVVRGEFGCGILIVDHDLRLIMRLCERIQVLAEGKTLAVGTPAEVRADRQVVDVFLGDVNSWDARPPAGGPA
jgi:ABC-type branched-subunit amino acid transport system ATPase component